jgi:hypothetical protein
MQTIDLGFLTNHAELPQAKVFLVKVYILKSTVQL